MKETISKAIELAMEEFSKEYGVDAKVEDGDEFATVFNDGVLIIGCDDSELKIKFLLGKPYLVDHDLKLVE